MIPEYDDLRISVDTVCPDGAEKERILAEIERLEIKQIYRDAHSQLGYGSGEDIKKWLVKNFHKSRRTIERYVK